VLNHVAVVQEISLWGYRSV